ncbi:MAG: InlB B-repeat-containing protein [Bacilli bacterium]|nr:InlB B-repeat-containing protein [Bacilli bacterium]
MDLIRSGNYDAAQEILDGLNWKDSKAQSTLISARKALDRNDYSSGIEYVCSVGGTVNLDYTCDKGTFSKTHDSIKSKSEFSLPTWTYNGYHITEWNVDKYSIDSSTSNYVADITLKASYDITAYTISLCKTKAGTVDETIGYNITKSVSIENPSRTGYTFLGWTGGEYTTPIKDLVIPVGTYGDITLVAQWELINYNITYYLDGGSTTNPTTYTIEDNLTLSNATKTGYTFVGWYTSDAYTKEVKTISNQTGDISLYAKFSVNTYTYLLDANGGTLENPIKTIKVTYYFVSNGQCELDV